MTVSRLPFDEMTSALIADFVHPPLHYYVLGLWFEVVGYSAFQARLVAAIFGILAVVSIYYLARYLYDTRTAQLSTLLLAISQLSVWYAQETRPYSQVLFFSVTSMLLFVIAFRERRGGLWLLFCFSGALTIYTHYYGGLVLLSLLVYALAYRKRYGVPLSWIIGGVCLIAALFSPWLISGVLEQALDAPKMLRGAVPPPWFAVHWDTPIVAINTFNNGRPWGLLRPSFPLRTYLVGSVLFLGPLLYALATAIRNTNVSRWGDRHRENTVLLVLLLILPMVLVIGLGAAVHLQYQISYIAFCAAPYYVIVAHGMARLPSSPLRVALVVAVLVYSARALRSNYYLPYKENYRDALASMASQYQEGDCAVFSPSRGVPKQWEIYGYDQVVPGLVVTEPDSLLDVGESCDRVWLTLYRRIRRARELGDADAERPRPARGRGEQSDYAEASKSRTGLDLARPGVPSLGCPAGHLRDGNGKGDAAATDPSAAGWPLTVTVGVAERGEKEGWSGRYGVIARVAHRAIHRGQNPAETPFRNRTAGRSCAPSAPLLRGRSCMKSPVVSLAFRPDIVEIRLYG